ncbi:sigma factor-like helix-turn-helix DNA-binding protein [Raineyella sp. LH-20]|uniref:sigma factor-like helix-turn-helix DNA-binding protein n=1 Tax=Raineyella sp. LH-20 TaxID=3081204 RepID=UPI0029549BC5|nr:helix-turn-helix domain-containing protein [Raineyella sp. LH-20]WOP19166.1 helix-turn-helix domain-containing protein [Raineyella sp. LH-20]
MSVSVTEAGCAAHPELYQHPLLEDDPGRSATVEQRRERSAMTRRATAICAGCCSLRDCLYRAVVEHDVAGFVAGTTEPQRRRMRAMLDVTIGADDLDSLTGVSASPHQVNHAEIVRLRAQNPHMSLETIAQRLGCSLSTVKRHLRRARAEAAGALQEPEPGAEVTPPSPDEVMSARTIVVHGEGARPIGDGKASLVAA